MIATPPQITAAFAYERFYDNEVKLELYYNQEKANYLGAGHSSQSGGYKKLAAE